MTKPCCELIGTYQGRRVLVTGHTGFKGSWLCAWLLEMQAQITGLALEPASQPNLFTALGLADRMVSHVCDIRDRSAVRRVFGKARPEIVFHLAAQPLVRRSYADPIETFAINVLGTAHVLDAARATGGVRAFVCVTTDKVYDNREWAWPYREIDALGGLDPYSASKAAAELVAATYQKSLCRGAVAIATARGGNVIGGGDWSLDRLVPDIVRAIGANIPVVLRNPAAVRPWQHVLELCEAYIELGARLIQHGDAFAEPWNFGPDSTQRLTVGELTNAILETWGCPHHPVEVESSPMHESQILRLDSAKALSRLSWRPRLGIREALAWTARWYKDYHNEPQRARAVTEAQINCFSRLMHAARADR